jgi:pimeloyl-ACP methyl ester carboxylesterase
VSKRTRWISAVLISLVLIAGLFIGIKKSFAPNWSLNKYQRQSLVWSSCYDSYQCATLKVPVNYEKIDKKFFTLQVLRHRATDQRNRIGSLIVNPGGPGGSGFDYAYNAESIVSPRILAKYDIVGFDPRGVNSSEPIRCLTDKEEDAFLSNDGKAANPAQVNELVNISKGFANKCATAAGTRLGHYSTLETAKDMELLRLALGEKKLDYLGKSYGTYLGTLYAALYPKNIGHMVLDGAIDPNINLSEQNRIQAIGFDRALNDFIAFEKEFTLKDIQGLIKQSEQNPLVTLQNRKLTPALLITALAASLYDNKDGWPTLAKALKQVLDLGNPQQLLNIADEYNRRDNLGKFIDNQNDISIMITCADWSVNQSISTMSANAITYAKQAPVFGPFLAFAGLPCKYWKAPPQLPKVKLSNLKTPPILIIGVTRDPATPYEWAKALSSQMPDSVLLTFDGEGHTGHGRGNSCIDQKVDTYFLTGKTPAPGLICAASGN